MIFLEEANILSGFLRRKPRFEMHHVKKILFLLLKVDIKLLFPFQKEIIFKKIRIEFCRNQKDLCN
jgi:hypothetical protein